jgi:2-dehydro-3-deoxy-D-gluconate 5-dehydrogenase
MGILEQFKLDGKVALVTGCKAGIGKAMALGLAEAGADIIGVDLAFDETESQIEHEIKALGRNFKAYRYNFANRNETYEFLAKVKADFPVIDILVSSAGVALRAAPEEYPDEYWDKTMEVNINSHFILSKEIGRDMLARGKGKIIFIASLQAFIASTSSPAYAATKGGVAQLAKTLANVWGSRGVNVNAIAPGWVQTDMVKWVTENPEVAKAALAGIPANRVGKPEDFKGIVVYLASEASDWVHGSVMVVDGGQLIR